jgi:hypothetical protein
MFPDYKILNKKAFSVVEYTVLFVIIIGAFLVMRNYIQRGIFGLWGQSGQSFAFGRQYDPQKTIECAFDEQSNLWYDRNCFLSFNNSQCNADCQEGIMNSQCQTSSCGQMNNQTSQ